jgi:hypothetical protein
MRLLINRFSISAILLVASFFTVGHFSTYALAQTDPAPAVNYDPACFNKQDNAFNTDTCKKSRSENADVYRDYCENDNERKEEGAVWVVFAQDCVTFTEFWGLAVNYILMFSSIIAGIMFVIASFKYLSSRGNAADLADAKSMLISTTIGIIIIASAFVIIQVLDSAFTIPGSDPINLMPFF